MELRRINKNKAPEDSKPAKTSSSREPAGLDRTLHHDLQLTLGNQGTMRLLRSIRPAQTQQEEKGEDLLQSEEAENKTPEVTTSLINRIEALRGSGTPLNDQARSFFEPRLGQDLSAVRIHNNPGAANLARSVNARAFTIGKDIVFGAGEYEPQSGAGRHLLAHELAHVAQQGGTQKRVDRYEAGEHAQLGETGDQLRQSLQKTLSYVVQKGEMPKDIAKKFGITVEELKGVNKDKLKKWPASDGGGRLIEGFNANETITIPAKVNEMEQGLVKDKSSKIMVNGVELEYGVAIAMGDLFESPAQMASASPDELRELNVLIQRERASGKLVSTEEWMKATRGRYLSLAEKNVSHFAPSNRAIAPPTGVGAVAGDHKTEWEKYHRFALETSQAGDKDKALMINAYGDHFLTDAFSAGHLINKPDTMELFKGQIKKKSTAPDADLDAPSTAFFDAVAKKAFTGDVAKVFSKYKTVKKHWGIRPDINSADRFSSLLQGVYDKMPDLVANPVAKAVHDSLNAVPGGIPVENMRGDKWSLSGDAHLNAETKKVALQAVAQSQVNLASAYKLTGPSNYPDLFKRVWDYAPRPTKEGVAALQQIVSKGTNIGETSLIDAVVNLIKDNYLLMLNKLVELKELQEA